VPSDPKWLGPSEVCPLSISMLVPNSEAACPLGCEVPHVG
jgi:hypothetical protein